MVDGLNALQTEQVIHKRAPTGNPGFGFTYHMHVLSCLELRVHADTHWLSYIIMVTDTLFAFFSCMHLSITGVKNSNSCAQLDTVKQVNPFLSFLFSFIDECWWNLLLDVTVWAGKSPSSGHSSDQMAVLESDATQTSNSSSFTMHTWDTVSRGYPHPHTHTYTLLHSLIQLGQ